MTRATVLLICAAVLTGAAQMSSQTPQTPTFRSGVELVQLDVSVYDKDHHPVRGLTAADFTLREDRKALPIATLAEVNQPDAPPVTAAWQRDATYDVATNDVADRNLFVIVIDDMSMAGAYGRVLGRAQRLARALIAHFGPNDYATVVFTGDNHLSQDFTNDHGRLLASVEHVGAPKAYPCVQVVYSVGVLRSAVELLSATAGRRKVFLDLTWNALSRPTNEPCLLGAWAQTDVLLVAAQRGHIVINTIVPALVSRKLGPVGEFSQWWRVVAQETGGQAVYSGPAFDDPNDDENRPSNIAGIEADVAPALDAMRSYYMLGYVSADSQKFHDIDVQTMRPGLIVETRNKYYWPAKPKAVDGHALPPPPTLSAIADILPKSDLALRATMAPFRSPGGNGSTIAVVTSVHEATPVDRDDFDVRTSLFTAEGDPRGSVTTKLALKGADAEATEFELYSSIAAPKPGLYEIRLGAHSGAMAKDGSVYQTVAVPDFAKDAVSLSGVLIESDAGPVAGPVEALSTLADVSPTTRRAFARASQANAFARLYQGGDRALVPIDLHVRVVDAHDRAVVDRVDRYAPAQFTHDRGADVNVPLPTGSLDAGPYLLTLDADGGKTHAHREVRFEIQ